MRRSAVVVVNPTAGGGRAGRVVEGVLQRLVERGLDAEAVSGESFAGSVECARAAADAGADLVLACGGDGTVHAVLQGVVGTSAAFGIVPAGTGNDNARLLGYDRRDPLRAVDAIASAAPRAVDVGMVRTADGVERAFLGVLSSGFDSAVNERANSMRWPTGTALYLLAILRELSVFRPSTYRLTVDGRVREGRGMLIAVGNGISYGGGMKVCPDAVVDDGLLDVTWVHEVPRRTFVTVFPRVFAGTHTSHPSVSVERGSRIGIEAQGPVAYADGDRVGPLPIEVWVRPGALRVAAP